MLNNGGKTCGCKKGEGDTCPCTGMGNIAHASQRPVVHVDHSARLNATMDMIGRFAKEMVDSVKKIGK